MNFLKIIVLGLVFTSSVESMEVALEVKDLEQQLDKLLAEENVTVDRVRFLIEQGASINSPFHFPLHIAARDGLTDIAKLLIDKGAVVNRRMMFNGLTPLESALYGGLKGGHEELAMVLIGMGADVNNSLADRTTPLHIAASHGFNNFIKMALERGAHINAVDRSPSRNEGYTPLHCAIEKRQASSAALLLKNNADIAAKSREGITPLHLACDKESAELLLDKGAELEARDSRGRTPLLSLSEKGFTEAAEVLLLRGASLETRDEEAKTALHLAVKGAHGDRKNLAELLLSKSSALLEARDNTGKTALHEAANGGHIDTVELLLSKGAYLMAVDTENNSTPLHLAVWNERSKDIIELLLVKGAGVTAVNKEGYTPLQMNSILLSNNIGATVERREIAAILQAYESRVGILISALIPLWKAISSCCRRHKEKMV